MSPANEPVPVVVIFREEKWQRDGEWIPFAVFPEEPGTRDAWTCECYAHLGQHSSMNLDYLHSTRPARPSADLDALRRELEGRGYVLTERKRVTQAMHAARRAKLAAMRAVKS